VDESKKPELTIQEDETKIMGNYKYTNDVAVLSEDDAKHQTKKTK
jgi:hypothetical protein